MVERLLIQHDGLVKRFILLTLVQQSGEATMDDVDELQRLRRKLYKLTREHK